MKQLWKSSFINTHKPFSCSFDVWNYVKMVPFYHQFYFRNSQKSQSAICGDMVDKDWYLFLSVKKLGDDKRHLKQRCDGAAQICSFTLLAVFVECHFVGIPTDVCSISSSQWCLEAQIQIE